MPQSPSDSLNTYHQWYYDSRVWEQITYRGVPILKWIGDLWSYQEVIHRIHPRLIVEFGSWTGGSALYFADLLDRKWANAKVLSVDIDLTHISDEAKSHPFIEWLECSTADQAVAERIVELRAALPGSVFFILDSNHAKEHVLAELENIRQVTRPGDYVVVEDGNINGHPVLPGWGDGPFEALEEYFRRHPFDYEHDNQQESKFGVTFAPGGYLLRR